jgi:hypothetical protein
MKMRRACMLAIALFVMPLAPARAQVGPPAQCNDFMALREETEARGKAIRDASQRKVPRPEACQLFNRYVAAESKMLKFMEDNRVWCGVPAEAINTIKAGHVKAQQMRQNVCQGGAAAPAAKPKAPTLGDALGTTTIPNQTNSKTGRGTLDSLTGNPLAR